jgi:hypothetical protein
MALQKQNFNIPISLGLDQKTDPFQVETGRALRLENARFFKTGKLQKRFGLVALPTSSDSTAINSTTVSAVVADNEYLAVKTSNGVYGYSEGSQKWRRQVPLVTGAKIQTETISINGYDQYFQDQDTTSDGTHTAFAFMQNIGSSYFVAVILKDNLTGEIKTNSIGLATGMTVRVACVKSSGVVRVHLFYFQSPSLRRAIFDEDLNILSSGTVIVSAAVTSQYDLCKSTDRIFVARLTTTSLELRAYDFGGTQTDNNSFTVTNAIDSTASGARGMGIILEGSTLHLTWASVTSITLMGFSTAFSNTIPEYNLSTTTVTYRVTLAYDGTNLYRISDRLPLGAANQYEGLIEVISIGASYARTSFESFYRLNIASQAFVIGTKVYFIGVCNEAINKTFTIFNASDYTMVQYFTPGSADAPNLPGTIQSVPMVPKCTVINSEVYTSLPKVKIETDDLLGIQHGTLDVSLRFSSNYLDNSRSKIGDRIYLQDGYTLEMDKNRPHENGFVLNPHIIAATGIAGVADPAVASKSFAYQIVYEYYDSQGNLTRSGVSNIALTGTTGASTQLIRVRFPNPLASLKYSTFDNIKQVVAAIYRTTTGPGSVFYRVGQLSLINNGEYADYADDLADSLITDNQTIYTTGNVLANTAAPAAQYCFSGGNRLFLVGLEEKDEVAYSKKQLFGQSVAFSDLFRLRVSSGTFSDKSPLNSGAYMDGKIILFRQQSIYFLQGDGPTDTGLGGFSEPEIISSDAGCTEPRSVLNTPEGVMFKSAKGIYLLNRGLSTEYIGAAVEDFNSANIHSAILNDKANEARFYLTTGICLVYNYLFKTWSTFTDQGSVDSDSWKAQPVVIKSNTVFQETENTFKDGSNYYSMTYGTPWLKPDLLQGYFRVYRLFIIGTNKSSHTLKLRIYTDYNDSVYEEYSLVLNTTEQPQYQFQVHMSKQKVESIRFELFDTNHAALSTGEAYDLSNIQIEMGIKAGGFKLAATKQY